ncbi:MAG: hypothetical protein AAB576_12365, partial [Elusimicrobiota bacterium]
AFLYLIVGTIGLYLGWRLANSGDDAAQGSAAESPFNVAELPEGSEPDPLPASEEPSPLLLGRTDARPQKGGPGLPGFVPETSSLFTGKKDPAKAVVDPAAKAEREFLRKHDATMQAYQERVLKPLSDKYYKKYPIVRQVDAAFSRIEKLMGLRRRYEKDRNAYAWARDVASIPEVQKTALKFAAKPEVWKVGIEMSMEALRNPPPKPIQDEMKRFITSDEKMTEFVGNFSQSLIPYAGRMVSQSVPAGTDLTQLKDLAGSLVPGAAAYKPAKSAPPPQTNKQGRRS